MIWKNSSIHNLIIDFSNVIWNILDDFNVLNHINKYFAKAWARPGDDDLRNLFWISSSTNSKSRPIFKNIQYSIQQIHGLSKAEEEESEIWCLGSSDDESET
jgi:hypothetical protein